jgi:hypothetical protein
MARLTAVLLELFVASEPETRMPPRKHATSQLKIQEFNYFQENFALYSANKMILYNLKPTCRVMNVKVGGINRNHRPVKG